MNQLKTVKLYNHISHPSQLADANQKTGSTAGEVACLPPCLPMHRKIHSERRCEAPPGVTGPTTPTLLCEPSRTRLECLAGLPFNGKLGAFVEQQGRQTDF